MELDEERRAWLRLHLTPGVGPVRARSWADRLGGAAAALRAGVDGLVAAGAPEALARAALGPSSVERLESELARARAEGVAFHFPCCGDPPAELREIAAPPLVLEARGRFELLGDGRERVAVVGARTPTPYGLAQARRFGAALAAAGVVVVSGYARGVDREAHRAALDAAGGTIAVLGSGLRNPYPSDTPELLAAIEERGCALSEFPLDASALRANFPRRNRILAGLSRAVVVIEAGGASGSLLTARWAIDEGREVCALPGRVDSPMSAGCHRLLRDGALLVESPDDVLRDALGREDVAPAPRGAPAPRSALELAILEAAREGATLDEISERTGAEADRLFEAVVSLELAGDLERGPDALYRTSTR